MKKPNLAHPASTRPPPQDTYLAPLQGKLVKDQTRTTEYPTNDSFPDAEKEYGQASRLISTS